uniref:FIG143263: glycosyl transferase / Lysophospholipid acyltransferase n=1 Tax=uncultured bacterium contig00031 TaxID=1181520 RepID=A0A806K0V5_9BACT|nr:FIG143263: glycosyl transferase / Lysophospholipid acyltransferase [uncultured bacterium contig00031]
MIILRILAFPVGFFYFVFSKKGRTESMRFLKKVAPFIDDPETSKKCRSRTGPMRHIISFAITLVEKLQSWGGKFNFNNIHFKDDHIGELIKDMESGKGVFLVCSHLGNIELLRAIHDLSPTAVSRSVSVTSIMDMEVSANFNSMLKELNPKSAMDIISAKTIGPDTAIVLEEKLSAGGLVIIAGDRTSATALDSVPDGRAGKKTMIPFLGEEAPFPLGAFYLICLMKAPVYFVFALRRRDLSLKSEYDVHVHKGTTGLDSTQEGCTATRKERLLASSDLARLFVNSLENYCKKYPFQWYNFFNFWEKDTWV